MFQKPEVLNLGTSHSGIIGACRTRLRELRDDPEGVIKAERYAMGSPLPSWQREACWTQQQQIELIESIWLELPIGFYIVNREDWDHKGNPHPLSGLLIDGQQRMLAIEAYLNDEFEVFGAVWSDVPLAERRNFMRMKFPYFEVAIWDEDELKAVYNRLNFSGVRHTEDQRA